MNYSKAFTDFLLRRVPDYDRQILEDIKPCAQPVRHPRWWKVREEVRRLSEGISYVKEESGGWIGKVCTGEFPVFTKSEHVHDRMFHVHTKSTKKPFPLM